MAVAIRRAATPGLAALPRLCTRLSPENGSSDRAPGLPKETGAYKIQLQSAEHRGEAHAFYESLGFRASSVGFRRYFE